MTAVMSRSVSFDVTCPVCGHDLKVVANGKPYRTHAAMVVQCTLQRCSSRWVIQVGLVPATEQAEGKLSAAIERKMRDDGQD